MKQVHIGGFTGCGGESLRDAVKVSRTRKPAYKFVRAPDGLDFGRWLEARRPGDLIVCGFDGPSVAVANALANGQCHEDALQIWLDEASQALSLASAEPATMMLVNVSTILADPETLTRMLVARTGMRLLSAKSAQRAPANLMHLPLAERLVGRRVEVEEMVEELSATALIDGGFEVTREQLHAALEAVRRDADVQVRSACETSALTAQTSAACSPVSAELVEEIIMLAAEDVRHADWEAEALQQALVLCAEEACAWPQPKLPEAAEKKPEPSSDSRSRNEDAPDAKTAPSPSPATLMRDYLVVRCSRLFDPVWYRSKYTDLRGVRDPALHFVLHGAREGRAASALFSAHQYRAEYADVARTGINPLVHYVLTGRKEGRRIFPVVEAFANQEQS